MSCNARPWQAGDERSLPGRADATWKPRTGLGYDYAWVGGTIIFSKNIRIRRRRNPFSPRQPAHQNIRLGHGISSSPPIIPRASPSVSRCSISSPGTREFRDGESASITELTPFGRDMEPRRKCSRKPFARSSDVQGGRQRTSGKYFDIPLRNVVPKPVQNRIRRCGCVSQLPTSSAQAGTVLGRSASSSSRRRRARWVHAYYNAINKRLKSLPITRSIRTWRWYRSSCVRKPTRRARARADGATFFQSRCAFTAASQNRQRPAPGTVNMWDEYNKWKRENPQAQEAALRGGLIGSPETIAKKTGRFRTRTSIR